GKKNKLGFLKVCEIERLERFLFFYFVLVLMYRIIQEGKAKIKIGVEEKISKKLPVFYNPVMKFNRDVSVLLLEAIENKDMQVGLPLSATGVRGIRFLKELSKSKIKVVKFNDHDKNAVKIIKQNLKLNKIKSKVEVYNQDANLFMLEHPGFDYIDIDPYGSPNIFLDSAIKRLSRNGILAVTATDTGCLAGTFVNACLRKYWAMPIRDEMMHETGLRILIRKVQLIGADHDKALKPIFSYFKDHYFRIFFRCEKGKKKVDEILKQHGMFNEAGPLWMGSLFDSKIASKIAKKSDENFLKIIEKESKISVLGFYDIHKICKRNKLKAPKTELLIKEIKKKGFKVSKTHFSSLSVKSDIKLAKLVKLIRRLK
ncbi:tRNA (guanine(26)-N(2))-dimethyltransferase, partial [Candidatus Woesearchaeota archaeon]|nr:tRNA (guanine(26)-N(2))-dimethyltransferase [Candidatus Woesearchaeota archaeon]